MKERGTINTSVCANIEPKIKTIAENLTNFFIGEVYKCVQKGDINSLDVVDMEIPFNVSVGISARETKPQIFAENSSMDHQNSKTANRKIEQAPFTPLAAVKLPRLTKKEII